MVSTKLVDGRPSPGSNGWPFYLIEVHHSRMAPLMGLERVWRRFDRLDTVPHVRSLGTVAAVGDTLVIGVGGSSATAWSYDVRTKEMSRAPTPEWLNTSWVTPPAAFSTDGRFIAYLGQYGDTSRFTVRTWPEGQIVAQSPPVRPRQLNPPRGGWIHWSNPRELNAGFPVSDSGPSIAAIQGIVRGGGVEITSWRIYPDYQELEAHPPVSTAAVAARADPGGSIRRLAPVDFPELPHPFVAELNALGCRIPQSDYSGQRGNVIQGQFAAAGQMDWAVLCSRNEASVIMVYWGGAAQCPRELSPAPDADYLQGLGEGHAGFSRAITRADSYNDYPYADARPRPVRLEHDGIENAFEGKASSVSFCRGGKWIVYGGND